MNRRITTRRQASLIFKTVNQRRDTCGGGEGEQDHAGSLQVFTFSELLEARERRDAAEICTCTCIQPRS